MQIQPLQPVGAIIKQLDINRIAAKDIKPLTLLLARHGLLIFRNQQVSNGDFVAFLRKFGPLTFTVGETPVKNHPDLNVVSNVGRSTRPKSSFHIDSSYFEKPPAYTALRAVELPDRGGETLFTNQYRAYESLPADLKQKLKGKQVVHVVTGLDLSDKQETETQAIHPIFKIHPLSGKKSIYMSTPQRCAAIKGMELDEAANLIEACYKHSIQEQFIYRHEWQPGDILIWDNGCTLHKADHSEVNGNRVLHRGLCLGYNSSVF